MYCDVVSVQPRFNFSDEIIIFNLEFWILNLEGSPQDWSIPCPRHKFSVALSTVFTNSKNQHNKKGQPKADKHPTSHFSLFNCSLSVVLFRDYPKNPMWCFVKIDSVRLNLLCIWILGRIVSLSLYFNTTTVIHGSIRPSFAGGCFHVQWWWWLSVFSCSRRRCSCCLWLTTDCAGRQVVRVNNNNKRI